MPIVVIFILDALLIRSGWSCTFHSGTLDAALTGGVHSIAYSSVTDEALAILGALAVFLCNGSTAPHQEVYGRSDRKLDPGSAEQHSLGDESGSMASHDNPLLPCRWQSVKSGRVLVRLDNCWNCRRPCLARNLGFASP